MQIDILTLFPGLFSGIFSESILKRALDKGIVGIQTWNIRDFTQDKHRVVDDYPYGGGAGMVMKPEPIARAIAKVKEQNDARVIYMAPQGTTFTQQKAEQLALLPQLVILCGHYEGIDERVRMTLVDEEISIGDYVLTGGELAAAVVVDADLLEYPQYTRPPEFMGLGVPEVLLSGHHAQIAKWRREESLRITWERRPDLLQRAELSKADRLFLEKLQRER